MKGKKIKHKFEKGDVVHIRFWINMGNNVPVRCIVEEQTKVGSTPTYVVYVPRWKAYRYHIQEEDMEA